MKVNLRPPSYFRRRQEKAQKAITPVKFAPVRRNPFKPQTKIRMVSSVHGQFVNGHHYDLVAGKTYWVDTEKADGFIVKGYAVGELSRTFSEDEMAEIRSTIQRISVSGVI